MPILSSSQSDREHQKDVLKDNTTRIFVRIVANSRNSDIPSGYVRRNTIVGWIQSAVAWLRVTAVLVDRVCQRHLIDSEQPIVRRIFFDIHHISPFN